MIIDGHGHACGAYLSNESVNRHLEETGADYVVLVPGQPGRTTTYRFTDKTERYPEKDFVNGTNKLIWVVTRLSGVRNHIAGENERIFRMKGGNGKIRQFYWIRASETVDDIHDRYEMMKFAGIKIHQCWERIDLRSRWFSELSEWLIAHELPLFIHLYSYAEIEKLKAVIKVRPALRIITAHCYGLEAIGLSGDCPIDNVVFDISNNYFVSGERIERAVKKIGSTKLCLGSDTPYGENALKLTIDRIRNLKIPQSRKDDILGENMRYLLKL